MRIEKNISDNHRRGIITSLKILSEVLNNKSFTDITREDILGYLDSLRKPDTSDTLHRWVSTYNQRLIAFLRFFKWLYHPEIEASKRQKPHVVENIPTIKRKEKSVYLPSDLWTEDDHDIFLRYCLNRRDRCYHAMAVDTSCRLHEILRLKIKQVVFKMAGDRQYAEVVVNGKTGSRVIPLFNSISFVKDWIADHPRAGNPSGILFCGLGNRSGKQLSRYAIYDIYEHYKKKIFPSLLDDDNIPKTDKDLLSK